MVLYIDYDANFIITNQTKFIFNLIDKLNMKFVRVFIYLFQFRLKIHYRFEKSNLILNVFNRLFSRVKKNDMFDNLNIKFFSTNIVDFEIKYFYIFNQFSIIMNKNFYTKLQIEYIENKI